LNTRYNNESIRSIYCPIATIFGSSACSKDSSLYKLSEDIGRILISHGYTIANGGYTGIMDATAKGAVEAGGNVIGITTEDITKVRASSFLTEEYREFTLMSRLELLIAIGDIYLVLPGSTGTLTELSLLWDKQKLGIIPIKPCIMMGKVWHEIYQLMFENNDSMVPKSKWKKDDSVMKRNYQVNSLNELKEVLQTFS
jgi:uncharacterized protein (TIGR00725 family)